MDVTSSPEVAKNDYLKKEELNKTKITGLNMKGLGTVESLSAGTRGSIFFITLGLTKIKAFL